MKRKATNLLLPSLILASALFSCNRKCADPQGAGLNVWLGEYRIIAPTAFTPANNDGVNDTFGFYVISEVPDSNVQQGPTEKIKDLGMEIRRGGILLYEGHGWGSSWDGKGSNGKRVEGLVDVQYSISDFNGNVSEGTFNLFVVPAGGCLRECMENHIFGDMIDPYHGVSKPTQEEFCQ